MSPNKTDQIKVTINENPIKMNPFVKEIMTNVVMAMVNSLKLKEEPDKIEITITRS